jgi:uncharacterized tellurite resistance protein B-like protein
MMLTELNDDERRALEAALYLLVNADGRVRRHERDEIEALADELNDPSLPEGIRRAGAVVSDVDDLVPLVRKVRRDDARELLRTILIDTANADDDRAPGENRVLGAITREWARG